MSNINFKVNYPFNSKAEKQSHFFHSFSAFQITEQEKKLPSLKDYISTTHFHALWQNTEDQRLWWTTSQKGNRPQTSSWGEIMNLNYKHIYRDFFFLFFLYRFFCVLESVFVSQSLGNANQTICLWYFYFIFLRNVTKSRGKNNHQLYHQLLYLHNFFILCIVTMCRNFLLWICCCNGDIFFYNPRF